MTGPSLLERRRRPSGRRDDPARACASGAGRSRGVLLLLTDVVARDVAATSPVLVVIEPWFVLGGIVFARPARALNPATRRRHSARLSDTDAELAANPALAAHVVHDLNAEPRIPVPDAAFDDATCCVSVDYLIEPVAAFAEVDLTVPGSRAAAWSVRTR